VVAHAARADAQQDLARTGPRIGDRLEPEVIDAAELMEHDGLHEAS
jgi:hypothetical protein